MQRKKQKGRAIFEDIINIDNLNWAYKKSLFSTCKYKIQSIDFSFYYPPRLRRLQHDLITGEYKVGKYNKFKIHEPKERDVTAPRYIDKIVQLALVKVLRDIYEKNFISDSYACIRDKGTHKAVGVLNKYLRQGRGNYGEGAYILKIDIQKYFYTINRDILKQIIIKRVYCQKTLDLIFKLLDSTPDELGLPLGCITSQLFSNVYLNELDQYCKRQLGIKYYIRYMDDITIILPNKPATQECLSKVKAFLTDKLELNINKKKTKSFPLKQGVNTIGFSIHCTHRKVRTDSKRRMLRKLKKFPHLIREGRVSVRKAEQMINSWLGHAKHGNHFRLLTYILEHYNYLYLDKKGAVRICQLEE